MLSAEDVLITHVGTKVEKKTEIVGKYNIHYVEAGEGSAVVLVHGLNMGWGQWYTIVSSLAKHFKVIAVDLPGAGLSTTINFSKLNPQEDIVDVLENFIQKKGFGEVSFVAHSLGAWAVVKILINNRLKVKNSVLVSPVGFTSFLPVSYYPVSMQFLAKFFTNTLYRITRKNMQNFLTSVVNPSCMANEFVDYFFKSLKSIERHPFFLINRMCEPFHVKKEFIFQEDELEKISTPVIFIFGEKDPLVPYKRIKNNFFLKKNIRTVVMQRLGHVPFIEKPEDFSEAVLRFLKE